MKPGRGESAGPLAVLLLQVALVAGGTPQDRGANGVRNDAPKKLTPQEAAALSRTKRVVRAVRVSKGPVVDGDLSDPVWSLAEDGGPLVQCLPLQAVPATEPTSFKILYDDDSLYVGVWCYDSEPDSIVAREMARDGNLFADDFIYIVLDTFLDKRNGYNFVVNPNGARGDALITNNNRPNYKWDGIYMTVRNS